MEENEEVKNEEVKQEQPKKKSPIIPILVIIILLIACGGAAYFYIYSQQMKPAENTASNSTTTSNVTNTETKKEKKVEKLTMTEAEFPKVDGATAMLPMVGEITKAVLGYTDAQAQAYLDANTQGKSAKVYGSLIAKEKDLIFASEPSDDLLRQAKDAGVEFDMTGIGLDGFVFLVNKDNPVNSLTLDQIRAIYKGEITNWKEVGGYDAPIIAYQREQNSGSQNLMEKMVMKGEQMVDAKATGLEIVSMAGLIDGIANQDNSENAIGYSIYLYAKEQYVKDGVKFIKINGVEANDNNISTQKYPLTKIVYAITRKDVPKSSSVRTLIDWLLTEEGQKVVVAGGYVGLQ